MSDTHRFSPELVLAAAHILKALGRDGFERMVLEMSLPDRTVGQGKTLAARANSLARYAIDNPTQRVASGGNVDAEIVKRAIGLLEGNTAIPRTSDSQRATLLMLLRKEGIPVGDEGSVRFAEAGTARAGTAIQFATNFPDGVTAVSASGNQTPPTVTTLVEGGDKKPAPEPALREVTFDFAAAIEAGGSATSEDQLPTASAGPGRPPAAVLGGGVLGNIELSATATVEPPNVEVLRRLDEMDAAILELRPIVEAMNRVVRESSRLGIGGNHPPEAMDTPPAILETMEECSLASGAIREGLTGEKVSVASIELSRRALQRAEPRVEAFGDWLSRTAGLFSDELVKSVAQRLGKRIVDVPSIITVVKVLGLTIAGVLAALGALLH